jgi:DNA end-binding protein Ku
VLAMARSIWNGAITFGTVVVPVKLFSAIEDKTVHFRELHVKDGSPIEHRRVSSKTGREVPGDRIVKGYETSAGRWVLLTDDEIKAIQAPATRTIDLEDFVPADQIDPVYLDRAYHVGVQAEGREAYGVLHAALRKTERVGIGRVVLRGREQLVALRAGDESLLELSTMRFADELVDPGDVDVPAPRRKPTAKEIEMGRQLTKGLHERFRPGRYHDEYRERVLDYLRRKAKDPDLAPPEAEDAPEPSDDLMAALQASLDGGKG